MRSALALYDSSGFHVWPRKLWLVCIGTTDSNSIARKVVSKTGIENCTAHFDDILNAESLSYQIQDILYGMEDLSKNVNLSTTRTRWILCSIVNKTQLRRWTKTSVSIYNSWLFLHISYTLKFIFVKFLISRTANRCSCLAKLLNYELRCKPVEI